MEIFTKILDYCISFVAFVTAVALVLFMLIAFLIGTYDITLLMLDSISMNTDDRQELFNFVSTEFLHTIAVLIILMKAYRILVEYIRHHHVNLKHIVEIAIIGCVLELLFNYTHYTEDMRLVLLGLAVGFLGLYVFKYDSLNKAQDDAEKRVKKTKS